MKYLVLLAVVWMTACSRPAEPTRSAGTLSRTFDSPEALAEAVIQGLARRDVDELKSLALSESEFREQVWPELPTSRPERNVPFDYAWQQMKQHSDDSLSSTLSRYGGQNLRLVSTRFTGETTHYVTFSVSRESEVVVADDAGRELVLRLYGSAMIKNGRYKVFSFVVD